MIQSFRCQQTEKLFLRQASSKFPANILRVAQRKLAILAEDINFSLDTINQIIEGQQSINAEIALRLSKYFGLSERFWLNLQVKYDIEITKDRLKNCLETEIKSIKT